MSNKYELVTQMLSQQAENISSSADEYIYFLNTASNNYKYNFREQLLIHAQKPDAVACADIDTWNKLGRWVNRGTKGIALLVDNSPVSKLRYVFDVSETNSRQGTKIGLWQIKKQYEPYVIDSLKNNFGYMNTTDNILDVIAETTKYAVNDSISDYTTMLQNLNDNSYICNTDFREEEFKNLVTNSITYMIMKRCGYEIKDYIHTSDFNLITSFNTIVSINILGSSVSSISEKILRIIEVTVKNLQKEEKDQNRIFDYYQEKSDNKEKSEKENSDDFRIQTDGRLSNTEYRSAEITEDRQIWNASTFISQTTQRTDIFSDDNGEHIEQPLETNGQASQQYVGKSDFTDETEKWNNREVKRARSNGMGKTDEQYQESSRGDSVERIDISIEKLPSEQEQIDNIEKAESNKLSAFSISQEEIDAVLIDGSGVAQGKYRIFEQYNKQRTKQDNINFLKVEYGMGGSYPAILHSNIRENHDGKGIELTKGNVMNPDAKILLSWSQVEKRIGELINTDRYLNQKEIEQYPYYVLEKENHKKRWDIAKEYQSIVIDFNQYMKDIGNNDSMLNQYVLVSSASSFGQGDKTTSVLTENNFVVHIMKNSLQEIINAETQHKDRALNVLKMFENDIVKQLEPTYDELNPQSEPLKEYKYSLGDKVYIGLIEYEVLSFDENTVRLYDPEFPLVNKEINRQDFDQKLKENPFNNKLLREVEIEKSDNSIDVEEITELKPTEKENNTAIEEISLAEPIKYKKVNKNPFMIYPDIATDKRNNFVIKDNNLGVGTPKERYQNNINAIKLLKQLEDERRLATKEEQQILSKYVGWGGLAEYFDENNSNYLELKSLLTDEEYISARESTLTAFYTPPIVIKSIYSALDNMSFKSGNILEPSCGTGNFMGLVPDSMNSSKFYGVEIDTISGRIAQQLYQNSSIAVQGFETTNLPDSFFDCAIGNVPFGQFKVQDKRYDKHNFLIHDYFFARTLDKVRPGGIVAFITSKGTLDKENPSVRKYIAQRADLIGAIRLPNNTFKSAAGTEVTSDILFLQKRDRLIDIEPSWVHLNTDSNGIKMNQYFIDNPNMIMGEMKMISGPYGLETACISSDNKPLEQQLNDAIQSINGEITDYEYEENDIQEDVISADPNVKNFSYAVIEGKVYYRENSIMKPVDVSVTSENRIKGMIKIRDCVRTLIEYQTEDYPDNDILKQQNKLNQIYDDFSSKYGLINSRANSSAFNSDSSYFLLSSLEIIDDEGEFVRKADMFTKRTIRQKVIVDKVDTSSEALALSLAEKAKIDMEYMSQLTGKNEEEIYTELQGVIFLNPEYLSDNNKDKYLSADEYLSGNVREKLKVANLISSPEFNINIQALKNIQPVDLTASEISVRLGATWIPNDIVEEFIFELFSTPRYCQWNIKAHYSEYLGEWNIEGKNYDKGNVKAYSTYGTNRINGYKIIEETLNLKDVRIFDYVNDDNGKRTQILNKKETAIAQGKQELIKSAFSEWIWKNPERRERLCKLYNEKFNSIRPRKFDGSHLNFVGMNPEITLRKHQVDAIAHILYGGNTLLAHVVGAGKTFEMVAAAQESKRLGLCQKSLFVVPNHLTEQWASEYLRLYPSANILVATKKDFETKNRKKFCGRIATGDYDAVIIGHSQFEKIPMSIERQRAILEQQLDETINGIVELKANRGDRFSIKQLEKMKKNIKTKLDKLNDQTSKDDVVTFEELGVDRIFVDEAHYYKNLASFTKMRNVGGIAQTEAMKSSDLYMKCRYLDEITEGRGVVFATGTPISNSMVEMYTMQKYLQYSTLRKNNLLHFDAWASTFGETVTVIELSPEGTGYRAKTRFTKFYNLPELMSMFKETADIQTADMLNLPVPKANYHNIVLQPSEHQKEMVNTLSERAEKVRNKMVNSNEDNMLLITNDGRKLALDQRLINDMLPDSETSKTKACADNVYDIYQKTMSEKSTQLVFCDLSTPHNDGKFNVYDDIRDKLIDRGIPSEEIAFIHSAKTEVQKKEMFGKVRSGQIRVLVGSTQKMGAGTNVQNKLIALHHLDCPWRPSDLQQREGRIIRQGNTNPEVDIYTYVTENTFDSYLYQLVESKQKFIGQIMTSKSPVRSAEDIDETALSYAEIKALCTGNPYIKEKMDLDIDVQRLKLLKANHLSQKYALEDQIIKEFPQQIKYLEQRIDGLSKDIKCLEENTKINEDGFSPMVVNGNVYADKKQAGTQILLFCKGMSSPEITELGEYRGFKMYIEFDTLNRSYVITLKNEIQHKVVIGNDIFGNIQRLDNSLFGITEKLTTAQNTLENTYVQLENAKIEVTKPFVQEEELKEKLSRLDELNILLNLDKNDNEIVEEDKVSNDIESTEIEIER